MIQKKKLCLVIPSLQAGGMERVMAELTAYFAVKENIETHLILYGITREVFYQVPQNVTIYKPSFNFNNKWRKWHTIKTMIFLRKTIKSIKPDSVLSFGEYWNNFVLLSLFGLSYYVFVSDRSQPDKSLGIVHDLLRHWLYPKARGLIFQTEKAREIFLSKNKHRNSTVIGNPIRKINSLSSLAEREKHVLMVGRLIETKHQDKLIEMFARVYQPDWKLVIVGYDHLKQQHMTRLKMLAENLNIRQRVVFKGKQDDLDEIYLRSSIFAFTSSSEGFPNVIGEAMAAGLPVIAFDCVAGPSEMISDGVNGYLVPLFDFKQFESKLSKLMADENLRLFLGSNAKTSILKFSSMKICESYSKFILD